VEEEDFELGGGGNINTKRAYFLQFVQFVSSRAPPASLPWMPGPIKKLPPPPPKKKTRPGTGDPR
jgi:hypothetical protein